MRMTGLIIVALFAILTMAAAFVTAAFLDRRRSRRIEHDLGQQRHERRSRHNRG